MSSLANLCQTPLAGRQVQYIAQSSSHSTDTEKWEAGQDVTLIGKSEKLEEPCGSRYSRTLDLHFCGSKDVAHKANLAMAELETNPPTQPNTFQLASAMNC